jgi:predicted lipoprotein with Yx(FWY)xxD motif
VHPRPSARLYLLKERGVNGFVDAERFEREEEAMGHRAWFEWLRLAVAVAVAVAVVVVAGSAQAAPGAGARLSVRSTEYGKALFGPSSKVLYVFGADRGSTSRCYGVCATAWPPLLTGARPLAGSGVQAKLLGMTKRKDGKLQVT